MALSEHDLQYLADHRAAAMVTVGPDGFAKTARVGVALVGGKLWSSGTQARVRTDRLRADPRCTLFVYGADWDWMALETTVTILEGPDAPRQNLELFRIMQGQPTGPLSWFDGVLEEEAFLQTMVDEGRLIYEFEVHRTYGMH